MKKEILDEPIRDSFFDFLEQGEKVLWEGEPVKDYTYLFISYVFVSFLILLGLVIYSSSKSWFALILFMTFIIVPFVYTNFKQLKRKNEVRYAITQHRVFFRQKINREIQIDSISFKHIPRVYLNNNDDYSKTGNISFLLKKPAKGKFWTYTIDNNHPHELPTFEHVKNPKEIIQLLQQQIKNANTSL